MDVKRLVVVGTLLWIIYILSILNFVDAKCKSYSLSIPYKGRYCTGEGLLIPHVLPQHCRYVCLQSATCNAYNYNNTDRTCTQFISPCSQAFSDLFMEYVVFTGKPSDQCYEWIPYVSGDAIDQRMTLTDAPSSTVARMQKNRHDIVGRFRSYDSALPDCYAYWWGQLKYTDGYPCQRLGIMEGCTAFWVPYIARDPIPPRAVTGGHMADAKTVYVTKFDSSNAVYSLPGHYIEGADHTITVSGLIAVTSTVMEMLVILWCSWKMHPACPIDRHIAGDIWNAFSWDESFLFDSSFTEFC